MTATGMLNAIAALGFDPTILDGPMPSRNKFSLAPASGKPGREAQKGMAMNVTMSYPTPVQAKPKFKIGKLVEKILLGDPAAAARGVEILRDHAEEIKPGKRELLRLAIEAFLAPPEPVTAQEKARAPREKLAPEAQAFVTRAGKLAAEGDRINRQMRARKLAAQSPGFDFASLSKKEVRALVRTPIKPDMTADELYMDRCAV